MRKWLGRAWKWLSSMDTVHGLAAGLLKPIVTFLAGLIAGVWAWVTTLPGVVVFVLVLGAMAAAIVFLNAVDAYRGRRSKELTDPFRALRKSGTASSGMTVSGKRLETSGRTTSETTAVVSGDLLRAKDSDDAIERALKSGKKSLRDLLQDELTQGVELRKRISQTTMLLPLHQLTHAGPDDVVVWANGVKELLRGHPLKLAEFEAVEPQPAVFPLGSSLANPTHREISDYITKLVRIIEGL